MKKILCLALIITSITGCSYFNKGEVMEEQGVLFRDDAKEAFAQMCCDGSKDAKIQDTKAQIATNGNLDLYSKLLAMEYFDLATYEYHEMGDKVDGEYFFCKAMEAAQGSYPLAENLDDWRVPRKNYEALKWAREDLMDMAYSDGLIKDPINMAKAQVSYDCWMEQQAEGVDILDARSCRKEFRDRSAKAYDNIHGFSSPDAIDAMIRDLMFDGNAQYLNMQEIEDVYRSALEEQIVEDASSELDNLEAELDSFLSELENGLEPVDMETEIIEAKEESDMQVEKVLETQYDVYFDWNYIKPTNGDKSKIKQVANNFKDGGYTSVILKAYTDRSGLEKVNQKVAENRARTIRKMLVSEGLDDDAITFFAFGEKSTPDPDGVRNAKYRKVIIIFE